MVEVLRDKVLNWSFQGWVQMAPCKRVGALPRLPRRVAASLLNDVAPSQSFRQRSVLPPNTAEGVCHPVRMVGHLVARRDCANGHW